MVGWKVSGIPECPRRPLQPAAQRRSRTKRAPDLLSVSGDPEYALGHPGNPQAEDEQRCRAPQRERQRRRTEEISSRKAFPFFEFASPDPWRRRPAIFNLVEAAPLEREPAARAPGATSSPRPRPLRRCRRMQKTKSSGMESQDFCINVLRRPFPRRARESETRTSSPPRSRPAWPRRPPSVDVVVEGTPRALPAQRRRLQQSHSRATSVTFVLSRFFSTGSTTFMIEKAASPGLDSAPPGPWRGTILQARSTL